METETCSFSLPAPRLAGARVSACSRNSPSEGSPSQPLLVFKAFLEVVFHLTGPLLLCKISIPWSSTTSHPPGCPISLDFLCMVLKHGSSLSPFLFSLRSLPMQPHSLPQPLLLPAHLRSHTYIPWPPKPVFNPPGQGYLG